MSFYFDQYIYGELFIGVERQVKNWVLKVLKFVKKNLRSSVLNGKDMIIPTIVR